MCVCVRVKFAAIAIAVIVVIIIIKTKKVVDKNKQNQFNKYLITLRNIFDIDHYCINIRLIDFDSLASSIFLTSNF